MSGVWRKIAIGAALATLTTVLAAAMGAGPRQDGGPPQPFFPEFYSGQVSVQGTPAPAGSELFACIDDCNSVYQSASVNIAESGNYSGLEVNPEDGALLNRTVYFYLINEFGRIQAQETGQFAGSPTNICPERSGSCLTMNLSFADPIPQPTPTPTVTPTASLPVPGDPGVTVIPKLVLAIGAAAAAAGILLLLVVRRRAL
ncbi:MAG: hypothetical protein BZY88_08340 [SAR202 cluster bacterium Io17-Chloro-G9]|nr:MAG: hypothetical protein BZY88_08340 [SAR202 cluster bacterium Io17-Chloro-G9]